MLVGIDPGVSRLGGEIVSHNTTDVRHDILGIPSSIWSEFRAKPDSRARIKRKRFVCKARSERVLEKGTVSALPHNIFENLNLKRCYLFVITLHISYMKRVMSLRNVNVDNAEMRFIEIV